MSFGNIAPACAEAQFEQLADALGRLVMIPTATLIALRASGTSKLVLEIPLSDTVSDQWLTVSEAARQHLTDVDGLSENQARHRVRQAIDNGEIAVLTIGKSRRIDANSFAAWRLRAREQNLDEHDEL